MAATRDAGSASQSEHPGPDAEAGGGRRETPPVFTDRKVVEARDGTSLNTFSRGARNNPAVVLVNAFGMPAQFWEPLAHALADSFFLVTWESRGLPVTDSPFDPERCRLVDHATDMGDVVAAYGLTSVLAVGWCSGCQVALRYAALPKNSLAGAVLLTGVYRLPDAAGVSDYARNLWTLIPFCLRGVAQARVYSALLMKRQEARSLEGGAGMGLDVPASVADMTIGPFRSGETLYRYAHLEKQFMNEPDHAWTEGVDVPILVVGAEKDQIVHPRVSREIAERLADAELVMKPDGDHFLLYSDDSIGALIKDFHRRRIAAAPLTGAAP